MSSSVLTPTLFRFWKNKFIPITLGFSSLYPLLCLNYSGSWSTPPLKLIRQHRSLKILFDNFRAKTPNRPVLPVWSKSTRPKKGRFYNSSSSGELSLTRSFKAKTYTLFFPSTRLRVTKLKFKKPEPNAAVFNRRNLRIPFSSKRRVFLSLIGPRFFKTPLKVKFPLFKRRERPNLLTNNTSRPINLNVANLRQLAFLKPNLFKDSDQSYLYPLSRSTLLIYRGAYSLKFKSRKSVYRSRKSKNLKRRKANERLKPVHYSHSIRSSFTTPRVSLTFNRPRFWQRFFRKLKSPFFLKRLKRSREMSRNRNLSKKLSRRFRYKWRLVSNRVSLKMTRRLLRFRKRRRRKKFRTSFRKTERYFLLFKKPKVVIHDSQHYFHGLKDSLHYFINRPRLERLGRTWSYYLPLKKRRKKKPLKLLKLLKRSSLFFAIFRKLPVRRKKRFRFKTSRKKFRKVNSLKLKPYSPLRVRTLPNRQSSFSKSRVIYYYFRKLPSGRVYRSGSKIWNFMSFFSKAFSYKSFPFLTLTSSCVFTPVLGLIDKAQVSQKAFNPLNFLKFSPYLTPNSPRPNSFTDSFILKSPTILFFRSPHLRKYRLSIINNYSSNLVLSGSGFTLLPFSKASIQNLGKNAMNIRKARFFSYKLSFFSKNDLKRILLRKPNFLKLLNSLKTEMTLSELDVFNLKYALPGSKRSSHEPSNLGMKFWVKGLDKKRVNLTYLRSSSPLFRPRSKEVSLKRIRFKPGYQKQWRVARSSLNFALGFNFRYQQGLTKRLNLMRRLNTLDDLKLKDLSLASLLVNARFVFDYSTSKSLISTGHVFLNGHSSRSEESKVFVGDFLQILVSLRYYIVHKWLLNWSYHSSVRLTKFLISKNNRSRSDLSKQVSAYLPDWILTSGYRVSDVPKYLEVDYFSLSLYLLYEPSNLQDLNVLSYLKSRPGIYSLYNWKFIN